MIPKTTKKSSSPEEQIKEWMRVCSRIKERIQLSSEQEEKINNFLSFEDKLYSSDESIREAVANMCSRYGENDGLSKAINFARNFLGIDMTKININELFCEEKIVERYLCSRVKFRDKWTDRGPNLGRIEYFIGSGSARTPKELIRELRDNYEGCDWTEIDTVESVFEKENVIYIFKAEDYCDR